jgi:hypothetical protein
MRALGREPDRRSQGVVLFFVEGAPRLGQRFGLRVDRLRIVHLERGTGPGAEGASTAILRALETRAVRVGTIGVVGVVTLERVASETRRPSRRAPLARDLLLKNPREG